MGANHSQTMKNVALHNVMDQPKLRDLKGWLQDYKLRPSIVPSLEIWERLSQLKLEAVADNDQVTAKALWCMETITRIQDHFVSAFLHLRKGECKEAWDLYERCEIEISCLDRHFTEAAADFGVEHIRTYTRQFQDLYPFSVGWSPALIKQEIRCSICQTTITLRRGCEHKKGEIYDGEMCAWVITKAKILHVSPVDNPARKDAVILPNGNDDDRLSMVKNIASSLKSPWSGWKYHKEERRLFHPAFNGIGRNDPCPCGSTVKYKRCCLNKETVFPHFEFYLDEPPPVEMPRFGIPEAGNADGEMTRCRR